MVPLSITFALKLLDLKIGADIQLFIFIFFKVEVQKSLVTYDRKYLLDRNQHDLLHNSVFHVNLLIHKLQLF